MERLDFYIDGAWVTPATPNRLDVINPATEEPCGAISLGSAADVESAVAAATRAFPAWSTSSVETRLALLDRIADVYKSRMPEIAQTISMEMGAPITLATKAHAPAGVGHLKEVRRVLADYAFETRVGNAIVRREAYGVCGLITPWNWPINQIACKVFPALAAGCTMVLKPSEVAPLNAILFAEILHEAGVPRGVFNLVNGDGVRVGRALSAHPGIDLMSFTGSTRAGIAVARAGAETIKKVTQELGGKSANIILRDADFARAIPAGLQRAYSNGGQTCTAPTRMFVPAERRDEAAALAAQTARAMVLGDPADPATQIGPMASAAQFEKIQRLIETGIRDGAKLVTGGAGRPEGHNRGYYVRPTVFVHVTNDMTIAREEIFGPVLSILPYEDEDAAIAAANDTPYGLSGMVWGEPDHARAVANRLRTGMVILNGASVDHDAPFGGYKQSGNGREWGRFGFEEFLEIKTLAGAE